MSNVAVVREGVPVHSPAGHRPLLAGVFVMSLASLLLELALTRIFSVILFYHFAFLAISVALLGLGAGGVFAYLRKEWLERWPARTLAARLSAVNAIAVVAVLELVLHVPVSLMLTRQNFLRLTIIYIASALPFFVTGLVFSVVFARHAGGIGSLYAADLVGGALACMAIVPLLNFVGGPNTVLFAAMAMALGSAIWALPGSRKPGLVLTSVLILLIAANYSGRLIDVVYAKGLFQDKSWVLFSRWNAISRVQVNQEGNAKTIVIDADASTSIMNVDPHGWHGTIWQENLMAAAPAVANVLRPRGDYAIIGPGGGVDVLRAVANGSRHVTGIEINPIIASTIMRGRYADYAYHLYEIPEVHIHVNDGRSFIRNSHERYDVLQMTLVDTWASTAAGAFALSENNLYTVEAFREYFEHLKPDGFIAITRWEFKQPREALRVVSQAIEALHRMGARNLARHFIVVSDGPLDVDGRPVAVLAKRTPFTPDEESSVAAHLAVNPDLQMLYLPSIAAAPDYAVRVAHDTARKPFADLIASEDPRSFAQTYQFNVAPVTDNAPFFFFTFKLGQLLRSDIGHGIDWKVNLGVVVLGMLVLISAAVVLLFLIVPLALHGASTGGNAIRLLYFVAIGLGYIMVEIAFIQRFVLFLGHPTYALTVVVFLMLLSSGAGSFASRRLADPARVRLALGLIVAGCLAYIFVLPALLPAAVGLAFALKVAISAALLVPLGFAMGMPFPSGLRALAGAGENTVEWAWAMNAASSVLGSVLAMIVAIEFGLAATLACGAAAYLLAALLGSTFAKRPVVIGR
jgi:hypothetical protein